MLSHGVAESSRRGVSIQRHVDLELHLLAAAAPVSVVEVQVLHAEIAQQQPGIDMGVGALVEQLGGGCPVVGVHPLGEERLGLDRQEEGGVHVGHR